MDSEILKKYYQAGSSIKSLSINFKLSVDSVKQAVFDEKYNCRKTLRNAVKRGLVVKESCKICGELKTEAHHNDYSKPLDVIWLCRRHHHLIHRGGKNRFNRDGLVDPGQDRLF